MPNTGIVLPFKSNEMSPRSPKQFEEMRQRSESLIIQAALELFATKGFHNTSIEGIRKKAGVSKGLIYNYFKSKDDLLGKIIGQATELGDSLLETLMDKTAPKSSLRNIINGLFQVLKQDPVYWKWMTALMVQPDVEKSVQEKVINRAEENLKQIEELMEKAGSPKPRIDAVLLLATLDGVGLHYLAGFADYPLEEVKQDIFERFDLLED